MALAAVSPSVFRCQCQQLVDLARTVQEVAGHAGLQKQEQRLALIATELQGFARSEFRQGERRPASAMQPVHVSLRDLCSSSEDAHAQLQELQGQLAEAQQDLKDLMSRYEGSLQAQEKQVQALSSNILSLTQAQEASRSSLEDHEARLRVMALDQAQAQEAAKDSCQRTNVQFDEVYEVHKRISSEVGEVREAFTSLEQELMESCSSHKQSLQTRQQQALEQLEELRFVSQQRHTESQEQFKTFQQLMLSQQWEAKQIVDGELRNFQVQLDKALWQKQASDWVKSSEDIRSPRAAGEPGKLAGTDERQPPQPLQPPHPPQASLLREDFPVSWRGILEDTIRRSNCLCEQTKVETDTKLGDLETRLRKCMKSLLDEQLKINQRTCQEASEAQETGQLSAELVKAAEASFKSRLERNLVAVRSDFQRDLESLRDSQQKVLGQVQQTLQSVSSDMEIAATSSARLKNSVKHVEATVKDMSVSVAQHQSAIDELKAEAEMLPRTCKRVDDLWRHMEGVKADLALARSGRESRAEILALSQGRSASAGIHGPLPPSPQPLSSERRVRDSGLLAEEPRAM